MGLPEIAVQGWKDTHSHQEGDGMATDETPPQSGRDDLERAEKAPGKSSGQGRLNERTMRSHRSLDTPRNMLPPSSTRRKAIAALANSVCKPSSDKRRKKSGNLSQPEHVFAKVCQALVLR